MATAGKMQHHAVAYETSKLPDCVCDAISWRQAHAYLMGGKRWVLTFIGSIAVSCVFAVLGGIYLEALVMVYTTRFDLIITFFQALGTVTSIQLIVGIFYIIIGCYACEKEAWLKLVLFLPVSLFSAGCVATVYLFVFYAASETTLPWMSQLVWNFACAAWGLCWVAYGIGRIYNACTRDVHINRHLVNRSLQV